MRKIIFIASILALSATARAQLSSVVSGEYFFDSDPGFGAATALPAFGASQTIDVSFLASATGLTSGMHVLGIRVRDINGAWSIPSYTPVYVLASDPLTLQNISSAEYFFDTDPGAGNATAIAVATPAPLVDLNFAAASSALTPGMHVLAVRVRNSVGEWSIPTYTPVYVDQNRTITKLEYFFDTDPGVGNGTVLDVNPDTDVLDQIFTMNSSALGAATHTLNVRVAGQNNFWGMTETVSFVICSAATPSISPDVVCVGSSTTIKDNSTIQSGDTYSWDFESDGIIDDVTSGDKTVTYPSAGPHTVTLSIDRGGCTATTTATVTVDDAATATAGPDQSICATGTATPISTVGGTAAAGSWSTSGDGGFDNVSALNPVYTPGASDVSAGNVILTFTTVDPPGACLQVSANAFVTIDQQPTVDAGVDLSVCGNSSATLNGQTAGPSTTTTWSTAGDGTFSNTGILNPIYTPGANDRSAGSVILTLSSGAVGACAAQTDQSTLIVTKDIALAAPVVNATIANPVAISVTQGGTFNTGDVLTTSIVTGPKKGSAQLQSGNMLQYIASASTVGADTVTIQVCNQCSQCATGSIYFNIQNTPPVVNVPPGNTMTGQVLVIPIVPSISDANGNIDLTSVTIVDAPASGAVATIDVNYNLVLDYTGLNFWGTDNLTIQVCDNLNACAQNIISIEVAAATTEVVVYNAVAPNSTTGDNHFMRILNLPQGNKVTIYNRWGDKVFEIEGYDNTEGKRFEGDSDQGKALPSGIYFYKIEVTDTPSLTGYLSLRQ